MVGERGGVAAQRAALGGSQHANRDAELDPAVGDLELVAAGGVAANHAIRSALQDVAAKAQTTLIIPPPALCTDNGAMIAWAGAERMALGLTDTMEAPPRARWLLDANAKAPAGHANSRAGY